MRLLVFQPQLSDAAFSMLLQRLVARGHTPIVVVGSDEGAFIHGQRREKVDGIDCIFLDAADTEAPEIERRALAWLHYCWRCLRVAWCEPYDLLLTTNRPWPMAWLAIVARLRRKRVVLSVYDIASRRWVDRLLRNPTYALAHRLWARTPAMVEAIAASGVARPSITLAPEGCDRQAAETIPPVRAFATEGLLAAYAGRFDAAQDLDALLDAAALLRLRKREDITLLLMGDGPQGPDLIDRMRYEHLSNVRFLPPQEPRARMAMLRGCDLGLVTLKNDPALAYLRHPEGLFDYLSAGLPVLVNHPGWAASLVERQGGGVVTTPENPAALADALIALADSRATLAAHAAKARLLADIFDRAQQCDARIAALEEMVKR